MTFLRRLRSSLRPWRRFLPGACGAGRRTSYSQGAEDLLIADALAFCGCTERSYLDVGAFDAFNLSNTYHFYRQGWRGVLVEANPHLARGLRLDRPGDVVVNCGVGATAGAALEFFVMSESVLSTFNREQAERLQAEGLARILEVIPLPVRTLEDIVMKECGGRSPAFLSLDIEGVDLEVVRSTDWNRVRPAVVCVETREYTPQGAGRRISEINALLAEAGYGVFAETCHNTIHLDSRLRPAHGSPGGKN